MFINVVPGRDSSNQYKNITFFAKGGMGEIYKAFDIVNNQTVAIKFIPIGTASISKEELLYREIQLSEQLDGKNIVKTYFTNKIEIDNICYFYIVQKFYEKGNLRDKLKKDIPLNECYNMMLDILSGLKTIHQKIIHRDLKPENILINSDGKLVITDFGISKYIDEKTRTVSFKGSGTYPYMAPECWLMDNNTRSMDIYSLGVIFYEILAGKLPVKAKNATEWKEFHIYENLPDIKSIRVDVPVRLKQIILKMTQKKVQERYENIEEIIEELNSAINSEPQDSKISSRLASIADNTITNVKNQELKKNKEDQKINDYKKILNTHISELYNKIIEIVNSVNEELKLGKIKIDEMPFDGNLKNRRLALEFNGKILNFEFFEYDIFEKYENARINQNINNQNAHHGFGAFPVRDTIFKKRNIIYLGKAETNFKNPFFDACFGYNLVLVKKEDQIYGDWFVASFSSTGFNRNPHKEKFAFGLNDFLKHFELSIMPNHILSVDFHELNDNDLTYAIEQIIQNI